MNTNKKFRCIVADPPWHYGRSWGTGSTKALVQTTKAEPMPYSQMSLEEIKALPVGDLADDHCDIYLWVTQKYLPESFAVLKAWGFRYCQTLTWCKAPMGTGQGGLYCPTTEFLILGRRGRMPVGKTRKDSTWWQVKRQKRHSQKPEFFQDLIEKQSDGPRLELFARRKREGWSSWGDEIPSDIFWPTETISEANASTENPNPNPNPNQNENMLETTIKKLTEQLERVADALEKANAIVEAPCSTPEPNEPAEIEADEPAEIEADEPEEEEPKPAKKRGRGRPKKSEQLALAPEPEDEDDDDDDDDEDEDDKPAPPKKSKPKPAPEPENDDDDDDDDDDDLDDDLEDEEEVTHKTVADHIRKKREKLLKDGGPRRKVLHVKITKKLLREYKADRFKDLKEAQLAPFFEELKGAEEDANL